MNSNPWRDLQETYQKQDWIKKPSLFAETAMKYFPATGKVLELGAGLGQDSRFFIERGYTVVSTDLEVEALDKRMAALSNEAQIKVSVQKLDLRELLPFESATFDVVYAHLSLHYFDAKTTARLFDEFRRVLKPGGVLAFLVNSIHDPQYNTGAKIEEDYFQIGEKAKRYFSVETVRAFTRDFSARLLDDNGETYKDRAKGVHHLVRFVGVKQ